MRIFPKLAACVTAAALAAAAPAGAKVVEVGVPSTQTAPPTPSATISVTRTTGFQAKVGYVRGTTVVPEDGRLVAWTVTLASPSSRAVDYFERAYGGAASAAVTVLRPQRRMRQTVVAQTPLVRLAPYFGQTVQFPLETTLAVKARDVIALTVPTWAPALAVGLGRDASWRASRSSRPRGNCRDTETQTAQTRTGAVADFQCFYKRARLTYSATVVTAPKPNATRGTRAGR